MPTSCPLDGHCLAGWHCATLISSQLSSPPEAALPSAPLLATCQFPLGCVRVSWPLSYNYAYSLQLFPVRSNVLYEMNPSFFMF